eukprot:CAMPEP_0113936378 /NCGR_PEP_ID=MMETSP1339-20121228/3312_1 /TAXON_ID=94617 /ORGANISM="Fibrocapsa japonica" /LENGTH=103 /DNA_ID=CAMNT_0000938843 /DNA_START=189 /DNA_END=497 /DNA_ORIENTATION=+ /assembly_acc=CAM_ASM_000762
MSGYLGGWLSSVQNASQQLASDLVSTANSVTENLQTMSLQDLGNGIKQVAQQSLDEIRKVEDSLRAQNQVQCEVTLLPWETSMEEKSIVCQDLMERILKLSVE